MTVPGDHPFALCLTHDVDRPYKRAIHGLFYARERPVYHLRTALPGRNPYWQFDTVADIERERGVRSAFYFLQEPSLAERATRGRPGVRDVIEALGRYDVTDDRIAETARRLADAGWEVGLHGSLASAEDGARLRRERRRLAAVVDQPILGGRQHRLRLERPETWRRQRDAGLSYDSTLGFADEYGFQYGYDPIRPFDDEFVVFPLTLMDQALPDPGSDPDLAWTVCEALLEEATDNGAVMTVLWHPRLFSDADFPGYRDLYERLLDRALEMDAWVGPPGDLYRSYGADAFDALQGRPLSRNGNPLTPDAP